MNGNDYEKFFFENKTGYCEYYAGAFTILARLAGIPSRIVTGYYGGSYNELGIFYIFKQEDAHSWVEVYIDNKWVRYDPTLSVPSENILETNNSSFINSGQSINVSNETKVSKINNIGIYFEYLNYVWTNSFLKYDEKSRNNFIKENLSNLDYYKFIFRVILSIIFIFYFLKFVFLIKSRTILYNLFFQKLKSKNGIKKYMTHQEIYKILNEDEKLKFEIYLDIMKKQNLEKKIISFENFYKINVQILKYAYFR